MTLKTLDRNRSQNARFAEHDLPEVESLVNRLIALGSKSSEGYQEIKTAIFAMLIPTERDRMPPETAEAVLKLKITQATQDCLHKLAARNQNDALSPAEKEELRGWLTGVSLLDLLHSKARIALKTR